MIRKPRVRVPRTERGRGEHSSREAGRDERAQRGDRAERAGWAVSAGSSGSGWATSREQQWSESLPGCAASRHSVDTLHLIVPRTAHCRLVF